jgi:hypothetical protein
MLLAFAGVGLGNRSISFVGGVVVGGRVAEAEKAAAAFLLLVFMLSTLVGCAADVCLCVCVRERVL